MNNEPRKRLLQTQVDKNMNCYDTLKNIEGYTPHSPQCSVAYLQALYDAMLAHQDTERQTELAYQMARDKAVIAEWNFHNAIVASKDKIKEQFGCESAEIKALAKPKNSEDTIRQDNMAFVQEVINSLKR